MSILDPAIRLVGRLSFRHKMHATAIVFGVPLIIALGVILAGLGARVSAVQHERDALAVQLPALTLLADMHQYLASSQAQREGDGQLDAVVLARRESANKALANLTSALAERSDDAPASRWLSAWKNEFDQVEHSDADGLSELFGLDMDDDAKAPGETAKTKPSRRRRGANGIASTHDDVKVTRLEVTVPSRSSRKLTAKGSSGRAARPRTKARVG